MILGAGVGLQVPDLGLCLDVGLGFLSPVSESRVTFEDKAFDVDNFALVMVVDWTLQSPRSRAVQAGRDRSKSDWVPH